MLKCFSHRSDGPVDRASAFELVDSDSIPSQVKPMA